MSYDHQALIASLRTDLYIGGRAVPASDGGRFDVIDPATGSVITSVANGTVDGRVLGGGGGCRRSRRAGPRPPLAGAPRCFAGRSSS